MKTAVTAVVAAIEAAAIALAVFLLVAVPALLLWAITFQLAASPREVLQVVAALWELVHRVPLHFSLDIPTAQAFALNAEPLGFNVSLPPALLTLVPVLLAARIGGRMAPRGRGGQLGVACAIITYTLLSLLPAALAGPLLGVPLWQAACRAGVVFALPALLAFFVRGALLGENWWQNLAQAVRRFAKESWGERAGDFFVVGGYTLRLLCALVLVLLAAGGVFFAVAVVVGYAGAVGLAQQLQLDPLGAVLVFGAQFAYLPVWIVWTLGWFSGAGIGLGSESIASPFSAPSAVLPALPVFGLLPDKPSSLGALAIAVVVLAGVLVGVLFARRSGAQLGNRVFVVAVLAGVCAVPVLAGIFWFASGSAGPGVLARLGVSPWLGAGFSALEVTLGAVLGVTLARLPWAEWGFAQRVAMLRRQRHPATGSADAEVSPWLAHVTDDLAELETVDLSEVRRKHDASGAPASAAVPEQDAAAPVPAAAIDVADAALSDIAENETAPLSEVVRRAGLLSGPASAQERISPVAGAVRETASTAPTEQVTAAEAAEVEYADELPAHNAADAKREAELYSEEELLAAFSWDSSEFSPVDTDAAEGEEKKQ